MIGRLLLVLLSSEKMDYYDNVHIKFINVATILTPGGQHFLSHDRPLSN